MAELGSYSLLLALALGVYAFVAGIVALARKGDAYNRLGETARRAGIAVFGAVALAAVVLVTATFQNDFSISYILHHSNRDLPIPYKFAVLWSGQEGSLLFWALLLSTYGLVLRLRHKVDRRLVAFASVVISAVQIFFLLLVNFAANPFAMTIGNLPPDGNGLNPLLQYPEMVIHPPMLYLGYVGFTVPFAFALAALIMKYPGEKWIHITRRWTMVTWGFLTVGIFLGARPGSGYFVNIISASRRHDRIMVVFEERAPEAIMMAERMPAAPRPVAGSSGFVAGSSAAFAPPSAAASLAAPPPHSMGPPTSPWAIVLINRADLPITVEQRLFR